MSKLSIDMHWQMSEAELRSGKFSNAHIKKMTAGRAKPDGGWAYFTHVMAMCSGVMQAIVTCPKPVIAEVVGVAAAIGLIIKISSPECLQQATTMELAQKLASKSSLTLAAGKRAFYEQRETILSTIGNVNTLFLTDQRSIHG